MTVSCTDDDSSTVLEIYFFAIRVINVWNSFPALLILLVYMHFKALSSVSILVSYWNAAVSVFRGSCECCVV